MKRVIVGVVLVLVATLFSGVPDSGAGAGGTTVNLLHGLAPGPNPVDVYVGDGLTPASWSLLADNVEFGDYLDTGDTTPGDYNFLICTAAVAPLDTITACADNGEASVNGNFGEGITIDNLPSVTILISYGGPDSSAPGRPSVSVWEDLVDCVVGAGNGRLAANHAAASFPDPTADMPVNVDVDGTEEFADLIWGDGGFFDGPEADHDVEFHLAADDSLLAEDPIVPVAPLTVTTTWLVGNPELNAPYQVIVTQLPLTQCVEPTTTTQAPLPTTPAPAPVRAATPTFTG